MTIIFNISDVCKIWNDSGFKYVLTKEGKLFGKKISINKINDWVEIDGEIKYIILKGVIK